MTIPNPSKIARMPVIQRPNAAAPAGEDGTAKAVPAPIWIDQVGVPELSTQRSGEESGDKRPGAYHAVAGDPGVILRRSDSIAFTVSHEFAILVEPPGLGIEKAGIFPADLHRTMAYAGRRLFRGQLPGAALLNATGEVLQNRLRSRTSNLGKISAQAVTAIKDADPSVSHDEILGGGETRTYLIEIEFDARATALRPNQAAVAALEQFASWQQMPYETLPNYALVATALVADSELARTLRAGKSYFSALTEMTRRRVSEDFALELWVEIAVSTFHEQQLRISSERQAYERELSQAARTWQRHFRNHYTAEDDVLPEQGGNPYLQVNQPQLLYRQLSSSWPDSAIWPPSSWPTAPENFAARARQVESEGDRVALAAIRREATVRAAVGRILRLGDEYRSAPRERGGTYRETAVDRILNGQDVMSVLGKDIPDTAAVRFTDLVVGYCRNLQRDRAASGEVGRLGVKLIVSRPQDQPAPAP